MKRVVETFTKFDTKKNCQVTYTRIHCEDCGREITPKGSPETKKVKHALEIDCRTCVPGNHTQHGGNWWSQFGLKKNPYVYGPMPYKRTAIQFKIKEARNAGHLAWIWVDGLEKDRL